MLKIKKVNYKFQRDMGVNEKYLVTNGNSYYWSDNYEEADIFPSKNILDKVIERYNIKLENDVNYYLIEHIDIDIINYTEKVGENGKS